MLQLTGAAVHVRARYHHRHRHLAAQAMAYTDDGYFGHRIVGQQDFFDLTRAQALAGHVDDIICAQHSRRCPLASASATSKVA
jgi:hypothetical protein